MLVLVFIFWKGEIMVLDYKIGDYIADSSCIYKIIKIENNFVHYETVWGSDKIFTASIPLDNLKKAGLRKIFTIEEVDQILKDLKNVKPEIVYTTMVAREEIYTNNSKGIVSVLVYYWQNQATLNKADRDLMEQILERLCQEMALVTKKEYSKVRENMVSILNKRTPIVVV